MTRWFVILLTLTLSTVASADADPFVVLVNSSNPRNDVSHAELVRMCTGEVRYWDSKTQVRVIAPGSTEESRSEFLHAHLGINADKYFRDWDARRFRGETTHGPVVVRDRDTIVRALTSDVRFLFVCENQFFEALTPAVKGKLKVLSVDGRRPDDKGYPLIRTGARTGARSAVGGS